MWHQQQQCAIWLPRLVHKMPRLKVKQLRSKAGIAPNMRETLRSLGLKRVGDVVVKEDKPEIRGMIYTVRHLIAVEEVK
jgi:large subunit ribosomal protein L30